MWWTLRSPSCLSAYDDHLFPVDGVEHLLPETPHRQLHPLLLEVC